MKLREQDIQRAIVEYLAACLPQAVVWACPNAARRTRTGKATNAVPGLLPGVFDLSVIFPDGRFAAIEVKTEDGKLSAPQKLFRFHLARLGVPHCVAQSVEDVRIFLSQYRVKTREALQ